MANAITPLRYEANDGSLVEQYDWGRSTLGSNAASAAHRLAQPDVARASPLPPEPVALDNRDESRVTHASFAGQDRDGWLFTFRMNFS